MYDGLARVVEEKKARSAVACGRGGEDPHPRVGLARVVEEKKVRLAKAVLCSFVSVRIAVVGGATTKEVFGK